MFIMAETVCSECGKKFIAAPGSIYKTSKGKQCSYTCYCKAKKKTPTRKYTARSGY